MTGYRASAGLKRAWDFMALSALLAISNLSSFNETWLRNRHGARLKHSPVPLISLGCCCLAWFKGRGMIGLWAFLPALLDPGTWMIPPLAWRYWKERQRLPRRPPRRPKQTRKPPGPG